LNSNAIVLRNGKEITQNQVLVSGDRLTFKNKKKKSLEITGIMKFVILIKDNESSYNDFIDIWLHNKEKDSVIDNNKKVKIISNKKTIEKNSINSNLNQSRSLLNNSIANSNGTELLNKNILENSSLTVDSDNSINLKHSRSNIDLTKQLSNQEDVNDITSDDSETTSQYSNPTYFKSYIESKILFKKKERKNYIS
jgi:hypothetical protein